MDKGIGVPVRRIEDRRFLTGRGRYTDDVVLDGQAYAVVVRSPHAHARVASIDTASARAAPGVLAVLTAADLEAEAVKPIPSLTRTPPFAIPDRRGGEPPDASQYPLARDEVRYAGEAVAFVVAETLAAARDAAERVVVDYEPLPPVVTVEQALAPSAPRVWADRPDNVSIEWEGGDAAAVDAALASAAHVARVEVVNNRVVVAFMEPRAAVGAYDPTDGRYLLWAGSQSAHRTRATLAEVIGLDEARLRVVSPDTGGGFGARSPVYPEFVLVLLAARRIGRPVRWTAERGEAFLTDTQSRDHTLHGALALDAHGRFTALRVVVDWRHGAYLTGRALWVMVRFLFPTLGGVYRIPAGHLCLRGVFTHTTPLAAYRGIGRIEATYVLESLVDAAARELGVDRVELRRRNLVTPEMMPWTAPGGAVYGSGEFPRNMERAIALADWDEFAERRREARGRGRLRGIGIANFVENDGGAPSDFAEVEVDAGGRVTAYVGTQDIGTGHETVFAQVVAAELGIPFERVAVVFGDTDRVRAGFGSHGSRSARIGGGAVVLGAREMVARGRRLAADLLEVAPADVEYETGRFVVPGTDRAVRLAQVAAAAAQRGERLAGSFEFRPPGETHSNGCHVCEVEIDPETGALVIERHVMVGDVGRALNPLIVEGQLHGGIAQGLGQAALERVVHDPDTGQLLSGSFMDYALPRADDLPMFVTALNEVPEPDNPLGVKGAGEAPTTGSPAALMNAVRDALGACGPVTIDMPATPERVWRAVRGLDLPD